MIRDPFPGWLAGLREQAPAIELFDAHTHIGQNDPDEFTSTREELLETLDLAPSARRGVPHARAGRLPARQRHGHRGQLPTAAAGSPRSAASTPRADPLAEAERCLAAGAAGIKLHPRAESFDLDTPELDGVFALAHERRLPGAGARRARDPRPRPSRRGHLPSAIPRLRLILAHAGICDLAWIWRAVEDHPNLFFDTSWWSPTDLLALFALVPPRHILFASDAPYCTHVVRRGT